jgi:RNA-directed DNA polymerase
LSADLVARAFAQAFLIGPWELTALRALAFSVLDDTPRWIEPLLRKLLLHLPVAPRDPEPIRQFLLSRRSFHQRFYVVPRTQGQQRPRVVRWLSAPEQMGPRRWPVLPLDASIDLSSWLDLDASTLDWLADEKRYLTHNCDPALDHYHRRWLLKRSGGYRLVEAPKPQLKQVQRRIRSGILQQIPVHSAAHGFVRGRSPLTHAALHVGKRVLLRLDLENFFGHVSFARVQNLFSIAGYPKSVSRRLAALCTTNLPVGDLRRMPRPSNASEIPMFTRLRRDALTRHLPQGAPTSPALANCVAHHFDARLAALADAAGATYSRYADDLAFSWERDPGRGVERFVTLVATIATDEGFSVQHRKTRVMRPNQRQELAGIVVNERPTPRRRDLKQLEAILTNCVRHGPSTQNRAGVDDFRNHLLGKVAWVHAVSPGKAIPLRALFERITWPAE